MADRRVNVKLTADASQFMSTLAKAAAATKALQDKVDVAQQNLNNARRAEAGAAEQVRVAQKELIRTQKAETVSAFQVEKATRDLARARANLADKTYDVEAANRKLLKAREEEAAGVDHLWRAEAKRAEQQAVAARKKAQEEAEAAKRREEADRKRAEREAEADRKREQREKEADERREKREKEAEQRRVRRAMAEVSRMVALDEADKRRVDQMAARAEKEAAAAERRSRAAGGGRDGGPPGGFKPFDDAGEEAGHHFGSSYAKALNREFQQRKIFIASVAAAALTAGAPVLLAAAGMMFGGIAAISGASSQEVKTAWAGLGKEIKEGTFEDLGDMLPELVGMADDLSDAFRRIRPEMREAFEATAPLVEHFSDAIAGLVEHMLPGMISGLKQSEPVMEGFATFAERVGDGFGEMFERMGQHSGAAGQAFADWGDLFAEILPLIGELLGQGAELANIVLPPLAAGFGALTVVLEKVGPLLHPLILTLGAIRASRAGLSLVSASLSGLSTQMANIGLQGTTAQKGVSRMATGFRSMGNALPVVGVALAAVAYGMEVSEDRVQSFTDVLLEGGEKATKLRDTVRELDLDPLTDALSEAEGRARNYKAAMDPLEQAQLRAKQAQAGLNEAATKFAAGSPQVVAATKEYEDAQADLEKQEGKVERAIHGVTQAMVDQADQAMAAIDAGFAYRDAQLSYKEAQDELAEAIKNRTNADETQRTTEADVAEKMLAAEQAAFKQAQAFGQTQAELSGLSKESSEYARVIQEGTLKELYRMRDAAGPEMAAAIQNQIGWLEMNGIQLDKTTGKAGALATAIGLMGATVVELPGGRYIDIQAPTEDQKRRIEEIGVVTEELPDGDIRIDADTWPAWVEMERFLGIYNGKVLTLSVAARIAGGATVNSLGLNEIPGQTSWKADGGLMDFYANGGMRESHVAEVAPAGAWRVWAEPETGGEAYIPLAPAKRQRSLAIWEETGRRLGADSMRFYANGGIPWHVKTDTTQADKDVNHIARKAAEGIVRSGALLGGGMPGNNWSKLWEAVKAAFPSATLNSAFRPGDPGYHGKGKAIDVGGPMMAIDRWAAATWGSNLAELIYTPGINLLRGKPHTYNKATQADHFDHVHIATYDQGGVMRSGTGGVNLSGFPERVLNPRETAAYDLGVRSREWGGGLGGSTAVKLSLDMLHGLPITGRFVMDPNGIVRIIDGRIDARGAGQDRDSRSWGR